MLDGPTSVDESSKSNQVLSAGRRLALAVFVAISAVVCLAFISVFWLAIFFADNPVPWILGLLVVGSLLGIAQATFLWSFIVDLGVWSIDSQPMRRIRSQFPAIQSAIYVAPHFAFPVRGMIILQSVIQILVACIISFFI